MQILHKAIGIPHKLTQTYACLYTSAEGNNATRRDESK